MAALDVTYPLDFDLTERNLLANSLRPIVAGDTWYMRVQFLDVDGVAIDLTDAEIGMVVRASPSSDDELLELWVDAGITIDADQSAVSEDGLTGKGWYQIDLGDGDEDALATISAAMRHYDIRIRTADGTESTHFAGKFQARRPNTRNSEIGAPPGP